MSKTRFHLHLETEVIAELVALAGEAQAERGEYVSVAQIVREIVDDALGGTTYLCDDHRMRLPYHEGSNGKLYRVCCKECGAPVTHHYRWTR